MLSVSDILTVCTLAISIDKICVSHPIAQVGLSRGFARSNGAVRVFVTKLPKLHANHQRHCRIIEVHCLMILSGTLQSHTPR